MDLLLAGNSAEAGAKVNEAVALALADPDAEVIGTDRLASMMWSAADYVAARIIGLPDAERQLVVPWSSTDDWWPGAEGARFHWLRRQKDVAPMVAELGPGQLWVRVDTVTPEGMRYVGSIIQWYRRVMLGKSNRPARPRGPKLPIQQLADWWSSQTPPPSNESFLAEAHSRDMWLDEPVVNTKVRARMSHVRKVARRQS